MDYTKSLSTVSDSAKNFDNIPHTSTLSPNAADVMEGETLEVLGYEPMYRRVFGALSGICIVMSLTSPLGAILVSCNYAIDFGGYWGLSWGWILPNLMLLPLVLAIAELCSSMPVNGGFYWWAAALCPPKFSRIVGFTLGWYNMLAVATSLAAFAYAVAVLLTQSLARLQPEWVPTLAQIMAISMGVITIWALLMVLRLEQINFLLMFIAFFLFSSSVAFIVALPVTHWQRGLLFASAKDVFTQFSNVSAWQDGVAVPFSFYTVLFVNSIWIAPAYVVEETHKAQTAAPNAIIQSYAWTAIVGLGISLALGFCIPDMVVVQNDVSSSLPAYTIIFENWGGAASVFLTISAVFSMLGGCGMLLTYSTQIAAFARDNGLPFSQHLSRVDKRTNIPLVATGMLVVLSYLFLLFGLSQEASDIVYSMASLASLIIWVTPVGFRLFAGKSWVPGPFSLGRFSWGIHLLAFFFTTYFIITRSFPSSPGVVPAQIIVVLGTLVVALASYFVYGQKFAGLNLAALETWRDQHQHGEGVGDVAFSQAVPASTRDGAV